MNGTANQHRNSPSCCDKQRPNAPGRESSSTKPGSDCTTAPGAVPSCFTAEQSLIRDGGGPASMNLFALMPLNSSTTPRWGYPAPKYAARPVVHTSVTFFPTATEPPPAPATA